MPFEPSTDEAVEPCRECAEAVPEAAELGRVESDPGRVSESILWAVPLGIGDFSGAFSAPTRATDEELAGWPSTLYITDLFVLGSR